MPHHVDTCHAQKIASAQRLDGGLDRNEVFTRSIFPSSSIRYELIVFESLRHPRTGHMDQRHLTFDGFESLCVDAVFIGSHSFLTNQLKIFVLSNPACS